MKAHGWEVYLNGRHIDTVFYDETYTTAEDVKRSLVNHDGYNPGIEVYRDKVRTGTAR